MEIKEITADEFNQKGCSPLPEKDNTNILKKIEKDTMDLRAKQIVEEIEINKEINTEVEAIKETKDITLEATKELFDNANNFRKHLAEKFETVEEGRGYSYNRKDKYKDKNIQKTIEKIAKHKDEFNDKTYELKNNLNDFGKIL